ncbi:MAG: creatinine amidohydrolase [Trebonia sp.]|jgi:creatinine amidohydrolase|nr:creatininase [Actinomycetes bacterium]MDX6416839.1 creatinine amidohydrolase [Trebonia sp.]
MPRHLDRQLERLSQPVAAQLLAASGTAVVAVGSVEQHGGHLPLGTDAFAAQSIAERVAFRLDTAVAPLGPLGVAPYHLPWPGSLSLSPSTLTAILVDVCAALAQAGVSRVVLVNWHEGNSPTLRLAAAEAQQRHGLRILIAETHVITHSLYPDEMEFTHAGSMETAAVLAYEPGLVSLDHLVEASDLASGETAHELFRQRDVYPVLQDFHDIAPTGWYGRPERAEAGRAEEIAEAVADHVVRRVREIWARLADRGDPVPAAQVPSGRDGPSAVPAKARR